jgi:hypothetical protein
MPVCAEILAMEALLDQTLADTAHYTEGRPYSEYLLDRSSEGLSWSYYEIQIPLDGLVSMFRASGRERHFELALTLCENMVAHADQDRDGDGHPEWDGSRDGVPPESGYPDEFMYDVLAATPIARLARIILTTPRLEQHYGDRARALADFVETHIIEKWLYTRNQILWLRNREHWPNRGSMTVRILTDLYAISGDPDHRALAEEFALQFIDTDLVYDPVDDCYIFPDVPSTDTSHSNRVVMMVEACAMNDIVFTDNDVYRLGNTLANRIWNGSLEEPACTNFHTGDNSSFRGSGPWFWGLISSGWVLPGRVHPLAQAIGEAIVDVIPVWPPPNDTILRSRDAAHVVAFCGNLSRNRALCEP